MSNIIPGFGNNKDIVEINGQLYSLDSANYLNKMNGSVFSWSHRFTFYTDDITESYAKGIYVANNITTPVYNSDINSPSDIFILRIDHWGLYGIYSYKYLGSNAFYPEAFNNPVYTTYEDATNLTNALTSSDIISWVEWPEHLYITALENDPSIIYELSCVKQNAYEYEGALINTSPSTPKVYIKDNDTLKTDNVPLVRYYTSYSAMTADISNINEGDTIFCFDSVTGSGIYSKENGVLVNKMDSGSAASEYQIGDIVYWYGDPNAVSDKWKSPTSKWLRCNGYTYDTSVYSDLYALLNSNRVPNLEQGYSIRGVTFNPTVYGVSGGKGSINKGNIPHHRHTLVFNSSHTHSDKTWAHTHPGVTVSGTSSTAGRNTKNVHLYNGNISSSLQASTASGTTSATSITASLGYNVGGNTGTPVINSATVGFYIRGLL